MAEYTPMMQQYWQVKEQNKELEEDLQKMKKN